jgi:5'-methylthioadenosine phosphorylase
MQQARVAIIGGSGLCSFPELKIREAVRPLTRYGYPSDRISIGEYQDISGKIQTVAFLPRHGTKHTLPPRKIPYKANIAALQSLKVEQIVGTCIAGSLHRKIHPGDFVFPDQFVNLTWGRDDSFDLDHQLIHLPMADPYCVNLRQLLITQATNAGVRTHKTGTVAVIQGPRFSTRAESRWLARQGWDLVNMTQYPECYFAREAGMCYAVMAMITDHDVSVGEDPQIGSDHPLEDVLKTFHENIRHGKQVLLQTLTLMPTSQECGCSVPLPAEYYKQQSEKKEVGESDAEIESQRE